MEENRKPDKVDYYIYEADVARSEVHAKRWAAAALIAFLALIATNAGWITYESQYEDVVTVTQEAETADSPIYQNGTGEMTIGKSEADNH